MNQYLILKEVIRRGAINYIDTGVRDRGGISERIIGLVLRTLINKYNISRDEVFISTKQGIIHSDEYVDAPPSLMIEEFKAPPFNFTEEDIVKDQFCIHPKFLQY